jgi:hypothetical protein
MELSLSITHDNRFIILFHVWLLTPHSRRPPSLQAAHPHPRHRRCSNEFKQLRGISTTRSMSHSPDSTACAALAAGFALAFRSHFPMSQPPLSPHPPFPLLPFLKLKSSKMLVILLRPGKHTSWPPTDFSGMCIVACAWFSPFARAHIVTLSLGCSQLLQG